MYESKAGEKSFGKTKKDVMKKIRQTLSEVKQSNIMTLDEVVLENAKNWFDQNWKIIVEGEQIYICQ